MGDSTQTQIEAVRDDYRSSIETAVDEIENDLEADPGADLSQLVHETADSSRPAMFTGDALDALRASPNRPEEWQHFVSDESSYGDVIRAMAFTVYRIDLWDEIRRRGLDD